MNLSCERGGISNVLNKALPCQEYWLSGFGWCLCVCGCALVVKCLCAPAHHCDVVHANDHTGHVGHYIFLSFCVFLFALLGSAQDFRSETKRIRAKLVFSAEAEKKLHPSQDLKETKAFKCIQNIKTAFEKLWSAIPSFYAKFRGHEYWRTVWLSLHCSDMCRMLDTTHVLTPTCNAWSCFHSNNSHCITNMTWFMHMSINLACCCVRNNGGPGSALESEW